MFPPVPKMKKKYTDENNHYGDVGSDRGLFSWKK